MRANSNENRESQRHASHANKKKSGSEATETASRHTIDLSNVPPGYPFDPKKPIPGSRQLGSPDDSAEARARALLDTVALELFDVKSAGELLSSEALKSIVGRVEPLLEEERRLSSIYNQEVASWISNWRPSADDPAFQTYEEASAFLKTLYGPGGSSCRDTRIQAVSGPEGTRFIPLAIDAHSGLSTYQSWRAFLDQNQLIVDTAKRELLTAERRR